MAKIMNPTKVITGVKTRWSYANVWQAKSINGGAPKYSVSLIIPKSDTKTVTAVKNAIQAAYDEGQSKLKGNSKSVPALTAIKTPLRDGDAERPDDEAYKDCYFINANSATAPGIVDAARAFGGLLRRVWSCEHQFLRIQQQRQSRNCLWAEQPAEDFRRGSARR